MQTFSSLLLTATFVNINQTQVHPFRLLWSSKAETPSWLRTASSAGILFNLNQTNSPVTFMLITNLHLCRPTVNYPTYSLLIVKNSQNSELRPCKYDQTLPAVVTFECLWVWCVFKHVLLFSHWSLVSSHRAVISRPDGRGLSFFSQQDIWALFPGGENHQAREVPENKENPKTSIMTVSFFPVSIYQGPNRSVRAKQCRAE